MYNHCQLNYIGVVVSTGESMWYWFYDTWYGDVYVLGSRYAVMVCVRDPVTKQNIWHSKVYREDNYQCNIQCEVHHMRGNRQWYHIIKRLSK